MNSFFLIFCIFSTFAALSAGLVVISKNPVFSVLFLITTFCNVAILLFLLNLDFLPVTFIIVYVGAIAVLFLFVIMMLNIKVAELKDESLHLVAGILLFVIIFVAEIFSLASMSFSLLDLSYEQTSLVSSLLNYSCTIVDSSLFYAQSYNMQQLGEILFVDFAVQFIAVSFVLLFGMIGTIILTLQKSYLSKTQNVFFQVNRNFNKNLVFYS
jgi:NADH-quinone oxidoreductase subunit J